MPQDKGYSYDELVKMGAKPGGYTYDEAVAAGAKTSANAAPATGISDPTREMGPRDNMNALLGEGEIAALEPFSARDTNGWKIPDAIKGLFNMGKTALKTAINPAGALPEVLAAAKGTAAAPVEFISDFTSDDPRQRAQAPGHFIGQTIPAVMGMKAALSGAADALPNAKRAGAVFEDIKTKAANLPVDTTEAQSVIDRANQLGRAGSAKPSVLTKADQRINGPKGQGNPPLTYPESFDLASKAKQLSAAEKMASDPSMSAQIDRFAQALQKGNRAVADSIGMGEQFDSAMKEYRHAMQIKDTVSGAVELAKKYGLRAIVGGGLLYAISKEHLLP